MAYSTQRATSDGTLVLLNLSIEYFDRSEISVLIGGIVSAPGAGRWNWVGTTNTQIAFTPAIPNGVEVTIKRTTQLAAPLNEYTKGAQFIAETLDQNFRQVLRIAQESSEGAGAKDVYNDVDYHGFKLRNVGFATADNDAVTFGQYKQDAAGASAQRVLAENARVGAETARSLAENAVINAGTAATNAGNSAAAAANSASAAAGSVTAAAGSATAAGNSATSAGNSATAAATSLTNFKNLYYGSLSAAPTTRPDSSAMVIGDMYFDSTLQLMRVRQASGWVSIAAAATGNSTQDFAVRTLTAAVSAVVNGDVSMTSQNGGPLAGFRNRIINGNMRVNQRGTNNVDPGAYVVDRFGIGAGGSYVKGAQYSDGLLSLTGPYHIGMYCTAPKATLAAADYAILYQSIEGLNIADLKYGTAQAKTITLTFRAVVSVAGTYCLSLRGAGFTRYYVVPIAMTTTATTYSVTVPGDTTGSWDNANGTGVSVCWSLACGSTYGSGIANSWQSGQSLTTTAQANGLDTNGRYLCITDVQYEVGAVSTPFESRHFGAELALCQRYYQAGNYIWRGYATATVMHGGSYQFQVQMRVVPSVTFTTNAAGNFNNVNSTLNGVTNYQFDIGRVASATGAGVFADTWVANAEF